MQFAIAAADRADYCIESELAASTLCKVDYLQTWMLKIASLMWRWVGSLSGWLYSAHSLFGFEVES